MAKTSGTKRRAKTPARKARKPARRARKPPTPVNPEVERFLDQLASDHELQAKMRAAGDSVIHVAHESGHDFSRSDLYDFMIKKWGMKKQPIHDKVDTCTICVCI